MTGPAHRRLAATLWDFDGTLADTEPLWIQAEYDLIGRLGGEWSAEHAQQLVGNDLIDSGRYIANTIGRPDLDPRWIMNQLIGQVVENIAKDGIPWRAGARELLADLRAAGIRSALVSASYRMLLDVVLDELPPGSFAASVAGDEVTSGKPDPEPYTTACAKLGVDPRDCVAFEDSPPGTRSAAAAGATVVVVEWMVPVPRRDGQVRVDSLAELDVAAVVKLLDGNA
jgi:HAD superfamily hydrolase (TIGR01509 family)